MRAYAARPDASTALLEAIGFAHEGGADWTLRGDERHAVLRYDAPARRPRRHERRHGPPRRLVGRRRRRARGGPRAGRRRPAPARREIIDRQYFHSVYFREPSGVLFELASRDIGFEYDEPLESLGESLKLPPQYESRREQLEQALTPLTNPRVEDDGMTELVHEIRPAAGEPEGALVLMHGRGADEHDLAPFLDLLDPKRRLVGVTPGGPLFLPPGGRHWYVVPRVGYPDPDSFRASYELLQRDVPELTGVPWERTILGGFSQGTVMAYALGLGAGRPTPAGIVAMSGFIPTVEGWSADLDRPGLPVWITHGRRDPVIGVEFAHARARRAHGGRGRRDLPRARGRPPRRPARAGRAAGVGAARGRGRGARHALSRQSSRTARSSSRRRSGSVIGVDLDDLPAHHREAHDRERLPARGHDDARGAVDERRPDER